MTDETFRLDGTTVRVVLAAEDTSGGLTLLEVELAPGSGATRHRHTKEDETIAVVSGRLTVSERELGPGEAVHLPRGLAHDFRNDGPEPVRAFFFCVPGGLERFFRAVVAGDEAGIAASGVVPA